MAPKERPPPRPDDQGGGPLIERHPDQLAYEFNDKAALSQDARTALPRARITYLARQIHPLGERPLAELFIELAAGGQLGPVLEQYARIAPFADFIRTMDGDRLPLPKIVTGRRP